MDSHKISDRTSRPWVAIVVAVCGALGAITAAIIGILPWLWPEDASKTVPIIVQPNSAVSPVEQREKGRAVAGRKSAMLLVDSVKVTPKNAKDSAWDSINPEPDPFIEIHNLTQNSQKKTAVRDNTTTATFKTPMVRVHEGDTIEITVYDHDHLNYSDVIGRLKRQITAGVLEGGTEDLQFEQVESLKLRYVE